MSQVVMLISNPFRPDSRMLKQAESLAAAGYSITILGWDRASEMPPEDILPGGTRVIRIQHVASGYGIGARQMLRLPAFWWAAWRVLRRLQPGLIHSHDFDTLPLGLLWGKLHRIPVIYDGREYYAELIKPRLHGLLGRLLYYAIRLLEPAMARLCSAVVTVDESLGAYFRRFNRRVIIAGHYPTLAMATQAAPVFTRQDLTLLYAGRLSVDRGLLVYAQLLRILRQRGLPARLVLAGAFTPASEEDVFRAQIQDLAAWVEFAGWVPYDEMAAFLRAADVGLSILQPIPRYVAALPVKLFEYMAAGLPVVASRFPQVTAVLEETGAGALVDPTRPEQAADCIAGWWAHPAQARLAGECGRQAILQKYNWETLAGDLDRLYRSLL